MGVAVEILSPDDRATAVARKVAGYLRAGTRAVWVLDPDSRTLVVHTRDGIARLHTDDATVDGGDALPGFQATVAALFPDDVG